MKAIVVATVVALAGCAAGPSKQSGPQPRMEPEVHVMAGDSCPIHEKPKPESVGGGFVASTAVGFAASVGGKLVSSALDKLAAYLGDDQVVKFDDSVGLDHVMVKTPSGPRLAGDVRCLVMVVAPANAFDYNRNVQPTAEFAAWFDQIKSRYPAADQDKFLLDTHLREAPSFYAEFDVSSGPSRAQERTVTQISPKVLELHRFSGDESWRFGKGREILVSVSIASPELGQPLASLTVVLKSATPDNLGADWLLYKQQPWVVLPGPVRNAPAALPDDTTYLPGNLTAVYSETARPHMLSKALAEAVKSQEESASHATVAYIKGTASDGGDTAAAKAPTATKTR
jgi:hypothetical protein